MNRLPTLILFVFTLALTASAVAEPRSTDCSAVNDRVMEYIPSLVPVQNRENLKKAIKSKNPNKIIQTLRESCVEKCEDLSTWLLSQSNDVAIREFAEQTQERLGFFRLKEAGAYFSKNSITDLNPLLSTGEVRSSLIDFYQSLFKNRALYSLEANHQLKEFESISKNKFNTLQYKKLELLVVSPAAYYKAIPLLDAINVTKPIRLEPFDFNPPAFSSSSIAITFPDAWVEFLSNPRYRSMISYAVVSVLEGKKTHNSDLYDILEESALASGFGLNAENAVETVLKIFASRGDSMYLVTPYFHTEHTAALVGLGIIAGYANVQDAKWYNTRDRFFSLPDWIKPQGCLIAKPYHFWMGALLSRELYKSDHIKSSGLGAHYGEMLYQFTASTQIRAKSILASHLVDHPHNVSVRLNFVLSDLGILLRKDLKGRPHNNFGIKNALENFAINSHPIEKDIRVIDFKNWKEIFKNILNSYSNWKKVIAPNALINSPLFKENLELP